jgi:hypothetical protein
MFSKGSKPSPAATATAADGSSKSDQQQGDTIEVQQLKEVVVIRNPPAVHVYDVVSHGRRFYRYACIDSDIRYAFMTACCQTCLVKPLLL